MNVKLYKDNIRIRYENSFKILNPTLFGMSELRYDRVYDTVDGNSPKPDTAAGVSFDGWIAGANVGAAAGTGAELGAAICTIAGPLKNGAASYR